MIVLDTSALYAAADDQEPQHRAAARALAAADPPLLLSPFVAAELDYMLCSRAGQQPALTFLEDVAAGAYRLEPFAAADVAAALDVLRRFEGLNIGLADASSVVLANRFGASDILTFDERHFRALRDAHGRPFRILPADEA